MCPSSRRSPTPAVNVTTDQQSTIGCLLTFPRPISHVTSGPSPTKTHHIVQQEKKKNEDLVKVKVSPTSRMRRSTQEKSANNNRTILDWTNSHSYSYTGRGLGSSLSLHLLLLTVSSALIIIAPVQGVGTNDTETGHHRCYICLPGDKSTSEARDILSLFPLETHQHIPDCAAFGSHNAHQFEFTCPPTYNGCLRTALGTNQILVARTCSQIAIDDCKVANSVEYCYCSGHLCNGQKSMIGQNLTGGILASPNIRTTLGNITTPINNRNSRPFQSTRTNGEDTHGYWKEGETDDEDLLGPNSESSPDNFSEGSGESGDTDGDQDSSSSHNSRNNNNNPQDNSNSSHGQQSRGGSNIPASNNKGNRKGSTDQSQSSGTTTTTLNPVSFIHIVLVTIITIYLQYQSPLSSS